MCDDDGFDGFDWEEIAIAGALAEEISESEKKLGRIRKEMEEEQERDKDEG